MNDKEKPYILNGERISKDEYNSLKFDSYLLRFPKGQKAAIQAHADMCGESLNGFIKRAIAEAIERDKAKK